jgi:two-component system chemotaxis response regulator CheY
MSPNNLLPDAPPGVPNGEAEAGLRPLDFLIVDDSAVMRAVITKLVRMSGLPVGQIHHAADGAKALAVLDTHSVDLMTVDINMAGMTGDELVRRLRADPVTAAQRVLIVSSERREERTREIEASGGGFLQKPFDAEELRAAVLRVLEIPDA